MNRTKAYLFARAAQDSGRVLTEATTEMQTRAGQAFTMEDGVVISTEDAFIFPTQNPER